MGKHAGEIRRRRDGREPGVLRSLLSLLFLATGVLIGLGALGHSFMGRLEVDAELAKFPIAFDVYSMLYVVWHFVGGCMVLFGLTIVWAFFRWRRGNTSFLPMTGLIGALYFCTGFGGFLYRHYDPFMLVFLVEGTVLLLCSGALGKSPRTHVG
jgi:hypothetical protein